MSTLELPERPAGAPERPRVGPPRPWRALWALPVAFGAVVAGALVYALADAIHAALVSTPPHRGGLYGVALGGPPPALTFSSTLAQDLALAGGAVLAAAAASGGRVRPADFGLRRARAASSAGWVVLGYVAFLAISIAWTSALGITDRESVALDLGTRDSTAALAAALLLVCVVAPICEELFFRGFLFGALRRRGLPVALAVSGLAFGIAHGASSPAGFLVPLAALGVILALLYERTRSLYPSIALHALNNSIAFGVGDGRGWLIPIGLAAAAVFVGALARAVGSRNPLASRPASP